MINLKNLEREHFAAATLQTGLDWLIADRPGAAELGQWDEASYSMPGHYQPASVGFYRARFHQAAFRGNLFGRAPAAFLLRLGQREHRAASLIVRIDHAGHDGVAHFDR